MKVTLDLPASLAARLPTRRAEATRVVAAGLRQTESVLEAELGSILRKLSKRPTAREVLRLRLSAVAQKRVGALLEKAKGNGLSRPEEQEWRYFEMAEHLVRMAKLQAAAEVGIPASA